MTMRQQQRDLSLPSSLSMNQPCVLVTSTKGQKGERKEGGEAYKTFHLVTCHFGLCKPWWLGPKQ